MHVPGWSCIFTGRWSMLDGLQICEKEPNFDSNIIYTQHTGVEKRQQQERPKDGRFFSVSQVVQEAGGSCLGFERIIYPGARSAPTPPQRAAPHPFKKRENKTKQKTESCHDSEVAHRLSENCMKTVRVSRRESRRRWWKISPLDK